jgi:hypothetical protein
MAQHGLHHGERVGITPRHDRELAVFCACLPARNGRIEECDLPGLRTGVNLARNLGGRRGVIDEDRSRAH